MRMDGIQKDDMKEAVLKELCIRNTYMIKSVSMDEKINMKLVDLSANMAVFETKHGMRESFTYSELYRGLFGQEE